MLASLLTAATLLALASCGPADRLPKSRPGASGERILSRSGTAQVWRLVLESAGGDRARATLRLPLDVPYRSLGAVVIVGGFEGGWRAAERVDPGPGIALLSVDYPFDGPRRRIPPGEFVRRAWGYWKATRGIEGLLREAASYLARRPEIDSTRILIAGGSLGVPFALRAGARDPRYRGVAIYYGAADLGRWIARNVRGVPDWSRPWIGRIVALLYWDYEPERWIGRVSPRPVLLISGRHDERVPEELAGQLFEAAREPREQVWIEGGHMKLTDEELMRRLLGITLDWAARHGFLHSVITEGEPRSRARAPVSESERRSPTR